MKPQHLDPVQFTLVVLLSVWSLLWKGLAMWRAVKSNQRNWFIIILVINTAGILELIYLFWFAKHRLTFQQIKHWFQKTFFSGK